MIFIGGISGKAGEYAASRHLIQQGYRLICTNYRSRYGEIDIIAQKGEYIVFAEVKARSQSFAGLPREAVDVRKQRRIIKTALMYLAEQGGGMQPRFDVIEVTEKGGKTEISHIVNAFDLGGYDETF